MPVVHLHIKVIIIFRALFTVLLLCCLSCTYVVNSHVKQSKHKYIQYIKLKFKLNKGSSSQKSKAKQEFVFQGQAT